MVVRALGDPRRRRAAALGAGPGKRVGGAVIDPRLTEQSGVRPSGFEVRRVRTFEEHVAAIMVANEAFSFSAHDADDELRRARETFEAERAGGHTARLLALDRGRPVASGRAQFAPEGVYLGGGATIPSHRRRGAMGSLVTAAWEAAVRRGTPALVALGRRHVDIAAQARGVPMHRNDRALDRSVRPRMPATARHSRPGSRGPRRIPAGRRSRRGPRAR
jgi:hypothetical protein